MAVEVEIGGGAMAGAGGAGTTGEKRKCSFQKGTESLTEILTHSPTVIGQIYCQSVCQVFIVKTNPSMQWQKDI